MTREQQIQQASEALEIKVISNPWTLFQKGAEWADQHPHWIPVEERLPAIAFDTGSTWDCSDEVCIYLATGSHCVGRYEHDKNTNEFYWVLYGVDKDIPVTHWMPLPEPPRKEDKK